jgi:nucleotide-binding universal stress UspA family protein
VSGEPVDEILAAAEDPDIVAVVMATHGRGRLRRAVLGSVADKVMRLIQRPLLLIRNSAGKTVAQPAWSRIAVPLDGSARAEAALPLAARLAEALAARLILIQAVPPASQTFAFVEFVPDLDAIDRAHLARARAYLDEVRQTLPRTITVECITPLLDALQLPVSSLTSAWDLVVMTTRGRGGVPRLLVGSVADRMVRFGPPVLLVPVAQTAEKTAPEAPADRAARA